MSAARSTPLRTGLPRMYLPVLLVLGGAALLLRLTQPVHGAPSQAQGEDTVVLPTSEAFPARLGLWTGTPVGIEAKMPAILETNDIAVMEYRLGGEPPVWVSRVGGFGTRAAFHPPELCYVGSNFEVLERSPVTVMIKGDGRRVMRLVIRQKDSRFEAWYWLTANGRVTPSYYQQQLWLALDAIRRRPLAGTLVRMSTPLEAPAQAHRRLLAFLTALETAPSRTQLARHDL